MADTRCVRLLAERPAEVARLCGLTLLRDEPHGLWLRRMLLGREDMTLLAHRGSGKTTCLAFAMAGTLVLRPRRNILFLRKTEEDVAEVLRQGKMVLRSPAMQEVSRRIWGEPVLPRRTSAFAVDTNVSCSGRGALQLVGQGVGGSLTGKHADLIVTDDIVNLSDRLSPPERAHTRAVYRELQNIRNPGGRIVNCGTPWHPEDAVALMPAPDRWDWRRTGLVSEERAERLRRSMPPSLFAANYELRHIAAEEALFGEERPADGDPAALRGGIAHLDAAYGGGDWTALTLGRETADGLLIYGRMWRRHAQDCLREAAALCEGLGCAPVWIETNGDKGYLARELRGMGVPVRMYHEAMDKALKIGTWLKAEWPRVRFVRGTDEGYIRQIAEWSPRAAHDDAPDSCASLVRALARR